MGTAWRKQAAACATSPHPLYSWSLLRLTSGIMSFLPLGNRTGRRIEGVLSSRPPDPPRVPLRKRQENDDDYRGRETGRQRRQTRPSPVGHQLINLFLTFRGGASQSERKSPFDFGGSTSRE